MSIYADHVAYARKVRITESMAKIWCDNQLKLAAEIEEARKCPVCGKKTLEYEIGSYEENERDCIYCSNDQIPLVDEDGEHYFGECDFATTETEKYEALMPWYDFDTLWAFSYPENLIIANEGLQEWLKFAKEEVEKIEVIRNE